MRGCDISLAATHFLRCNFYPLRFQYLEFPIKLIENPKRILWIRIWNRLAHYLLKTYPRFVGNSCGKYDVMHSHFAPNGWKYIKLSKKLNIPHIVSFYGLDYEHLPFREPVWKERYTTLFKEADLFICEGSHGAKILQRIGCPIEKIKVVRLGVDADCIPLWKRRKEANELNLLQVAAYTEKKGHRYSIDAFTLALRDCPNMTLTFAGHDKQRIKADLQNSVLNSAVDKIIFMDAVDFDHLHTFMKDYHVLIHPSCYTKALDCEGGAPVVLLDAQATGMPIIATTHCDIPEEVKHGKTGFLSPEKDTESLAEYIKYFYKMHQSEFNMYSNNARNHIINEYDVNKSSSMMVGIYRRLKNKNKLFGN